MRHHRWDSGLGLSNVKFGSIDALSATIASGLGGQRPPAPVAVEDRETQSGPGGEAQPRLGRQRGHQRRAGEGSEGGDEVGGGHTEGAVPIRLEAAQDRHAGADEAEGEQREVDMPVIRPESTVSYDDFQLSYALDRLNGRIVAPGGVAANVSNDSQPATEAR